MVWRRRKSFGGVKLTVTSSAWKAAAMMPARVSMVMLLFALVSRRTNLAKQRAPLPHISAAAAVAVEEIPGPVGAAGRAGEEDEKAVGADAGVAVAQPGDLAGMEMRLAGAAVN